MELLPEEGDEAGDLCGSFEDELVEEENGWSKVEGSEAVVESCSAIGDAAEKEDAEVSSSKNAFESMSWEAKSVELMRVQAFESVRRRCFGLEMLRSYTQRGALESVLESRSKEAALARRLAARKSKIEEAYGEALGELGVLGEEKLPWSTALCEVERGRGTRRLESALRLRREGLARASRLDVALNDTLRELRDVGEQALGAASAAARCVERLFEAYVAAAAATHGAARGLGPSADMWLADARYRAAAAVLETAWRRCSADLANVFAKAKGLAVDSRAELRAARAALADACELELPGEQNDDAAAVAAVLKERAADLAKQRRRAAGAPDIAPDAPQATPPDDLSLDGPLVSPLVLDVRLVDRRHQGLGTKSWRPCLLVVTADKFLHAFDLDARDPPSNVDAAFDHLVADYARALLAHRDTPDLPLKPSLSVDLAKCAILPYPPATPHSHLDLVETVQNVGPKKIIYKTQVRKVCLKTYPAPQALPGDPLAELRKLLLQATPSRVERLTQGP